MSVKEENLSLERLKELLSYDSSTGEFYWRKSRGPRAAGSVAGWKLTQGHIAIEIDGIAFYAHRLAWFYTSGIWPLEMIDHINGLPCDNRIENLRSVPRSINAQNQRKPSKNNKQGFLGVYLQRGKYRALIQVPGARRQKHLGIFNTPEQAYSAYLSAKREMHPGNTI